jgi:hypothetical protein
MKAGTTATRTIQIHATTTTTTLLSANSSCPCFSLVTPLPVTVAAGQSQPLAVRAAGASQGIATMTLRTTQGDVPLTIEVTESERQGGRDLLKRYLQQAIERQCSVWFIIHDLHGQLRNCGCTASSLGGIDILATLPDTCRQLAAQVPCRFILTGDVDGRHAGVGQALSASGWQIHNTNSVTPQEPQLIVTPDPTAYLTHPHIAAILTTSPSSVHHPRIVLPVAEGGMLANVLLIDAHGDMTEQELLPIDRSLPAQSRILDAFPQRLTPEIRTTASRLSETCASCHQSAHTTWERSRHAHAWNSLTPADRTDTCATCHSTPLATDPTTIATGVACQACHQDSDAHVSSAGTIKTGRITNCRDCHSPRQDPAFVRKNAWQTILHGKDVSAAPIPAPQTKPSLLP